MTTPTPETPAGGLTAAEVAEQMCPQRHGGPCQSCQEAAPGVLRIVAAAVVQARAEDRARIEAIAAEWIAVGDNEGATAADDRVIGAWYSAGLRLRAALAATEDGDPT